MPGLSGLEGGAFPEKTTKEKAPKEKKTWQAADALATLAAQALSSSNSLRELGQNMMQAGASFISQFAQNTIGGPLGQLAGGLVNFGFNLLFHHDQGLPVRDNAMDVRVINFSDMYMDMAAVRDRGELSFSKARREQWATAAAVQRGV